MVNPGHASRACAPCKAAKVKCSEERPTCSRCTRRGCVCAYPDLPYRDMNRWTASAVQTRVSKKLSARAAAQEGEEDQPSQAGSLLLTTPTQDLVRDAVAVFFIAFVRQPDHLESTWGYLTSLPNAYRHADLAILSQATDACALSYMFNRSGISGLDTEAARQYGKAVKSLAGSLQRPAKEASDETLACMMLLSLYETISGTGLHSTAPYHAHQLGQSAGALVRLQKIARDDKYVGDGEFRDRSVLPHSNRQLVWSDVLRGRVPLPSTTVWPKGTYRSWLEEASTRFVIRVATVCGHFKGLLESSRGNRNEAFFESLTDLATEAMSVYKDMEACFVNAPATWKPHVLADKVVKAASDQPQSHDRDLADQMARVVLVGDVDPDQAELPPYTPRLDVFPSKSIMQIWLCVRAAQVFLLRVLLLMHALLHSSKTFPQQARTAVLPSSRTLHEFLARTVHDICSSVPYALGDVPPPSSSSSSSAGCAESQKTDENSSSGPCADLPSLIFILYKVYNAPDLSRELRTWLVDVFERVGKEFHILQALKLAEMCKQQRDAEGLAKKQPLDSHWLVMCAPNLDLGGEDGQTERREVVRS